MTAYLAFRAARLLLLLLLAAVFVALASGRPVSRRLRLALAALVVLSAAAFVNFGFFHALGRQPVHYWDAFHYFVGAKYLPELGYTRLYEAAWTAGRDMGAFEGIDRVRDLPTYQVRDVRSIDTAAIRARFTDDRWLAFKRDLLVFGPRIPDWRRLFLDHGYNDPPPRALLLHVLVGGLPATPTTLTVLSALDYVLIAAALWLARRAFGPVAGAAGAAFFLLSFFGRFDFIGGSILRWDWIAALVGGVACLARGAGATAGLLLGYAAVARLFPVLFLVPLVIKWLQARRAHAPDRALTRCLGAAGGVLVTAAIAAGLAGDRVFTAEFLVKIWTHGGTAFTNHVGLGSWLLFHTAPWIVVDGMQVVTPAAMAAARPAAWVAPAAAALYLAAALPLILRARAVESILYAVPLVYCALSPAGYYYSFLVLLVLVPWHRGAPDRARLLAMALLALVGAGAYALEIASDDFLPLFHAASTLLGVYLLAWLALEYARLRVPAFGLAPALDRVAPPKI